MVAPMIQRIPIGVDESSSILATYSARAAEEAVLPGFPRGLRYPAILCEEKSSFVRVSSTVLSPKFTARRGFLPLALAVKAFFLRGQLGLLARLLQGSLSPQLTDLA